VDSVVVCDSVVVDEVVVVSGPQTFRLGLGGVSFPRDDPVMKFQPSTSPAAGDREAGPTAEYWNEPEPDRQMK
jgi:hypothetical protein